MPWGQIGRESTPYAYTGGGCVLTSGLHVYTQWWLNRFPNDQKRPLPLCTSEPMCLPRLLQIELRGSSNTGMVLLVMSGQY